MIAHALVLLAAGLLQPVQLQSVPQPAYIDEAAGILRTFMEDPSDLNAQALEKLGLDLVQSAFQEALTRKRKPSKTQGKVELGEDYYLFELPEDYDPSKPYPMMISLHGNPPRHCERVHHKYWRSDTARHGYVLISPNLDGGRWHRPIGETKLFKTLRDAVTRFHVDTSRIYVGGYSAGASGTWNIVTRYRELFAGAVIRCGKRRVSNAMLQGLAGKGIFVIHAAQDDKCPVSGARNAVKVLKKYGVDHRYREYPGAHDFYWHSNDDALEYLSGFSTGPAQSFEFRGPFRTEHRIMHYVSIKGKEHKGAVKRGPEGISITISDLTDVEHLDLYFNATFAGLGKTVSVTVNEANTVCAPQMSISAFVRAWRLYPYYRPSQDRSPFVAACRVVLDGKVLAKPTSL